ncbi:MAG: C4-dicarboxylate TRAP transporter substrate-binding protein [Burkholderiaceae bacterium]
MQSNYALRGVIALVASASLSFSSSASAEQSEINFASPLPSIHALNKQIGSWLERVTEASGGEIKFNWYPGGTVAKVTKALASVKGGLADVSYMIDAYTSSEVPYEVMASRNGGFGADALVMSAAANEYLLLNCEQCRNDWRKNGVIAMAHVSTTPFYLACREKLTSAADLKGKKIRSPGSFGVVTKEYGGIPVNIPITETFEALQRGQADCTYAADAHMKSYSFNEVAKHMTRQSFGVYMSGAPFVISESKWKSLPAKHRELIQSQLADLVTAGTWAYIDEAKVARKESEERGVAYHEPEADLTEARDRYLGKLVDVAKEEAKKRRLTNAAEIMAKFPPVHQKWQKIVAEIGSDRDKYREALVREIYSKVKF